MREVVGDRVHVHRLEPAGDTDIAGLAGLDDDVAGAAFDGELEEVVENFGVRGHGRGKIGKRMGVVKNVVDLLAGTVLLRKVTFHVPP